MSLGVQLHTLVTLVTHCLVCPHVLAKQMDTGMALSYTVIVSIISFSSSDCNILFILAAVNCSSPVDPVNGQINLPNGTTFGNTAVYTCATGYALSGSSLRSCGADGNWTNTSPICYSMKITSES